MMFHANNLQPCYKEYKYERTLQNPEVQMQNKNRLTVACPYNTHPDNGQILWKHQGAAIFPWTISNHAPFKLSFAALLWKRDWLKLGVGIQINNAGQSGSLQLQADRLEL